jgi:hypothetical protein
MTRIRIEHEIECCGAYCQATREKWCKFLRPGATWWCYAYEKDLTETVVGDFGWAHRCKECLKAEVKE